MFDLLELIETTWDKGEPIVIYHDYRENKISYLALPGQYFTSALMKEFRTKGSGIIRLIISHKFAHAFDIPIIANLLDGRSSRFKILEFMNIMNKENDYSLSKSISLNHKNVKNGILDEDRALTISEFSNIIDDFLAGNSVKSIAKRISSDFVYPGQIEIHRTEYGLLKRKTSIAEIVIALSELVNQTPSIVINEIIMDDDNYKTIEKFCVSNGYPLINSTTVIHLWRSIKKIDKNNIAPY